jgi:hypothetical protein
VQTNVRAVQIARNKRRPLRWASEPFNCVNGYPFELVVAFAQTPISDLMIGLGPRGESNYLKPAWKRFPSRFHRCVLKAAIPTHLLSK